MTLVTKLHKNPTLCKYVKQQQKKRWPNREYPVKFCLEITTNNTVMQDLKLIYVSKTDRVLNGLQVSHLLPTVFLQIILCWVSSPKNHLRKWASYCKNSCHKAGHHPLSASLTNPSFVPFSSLSVFWHEFSYPEDLTRSSTRGSVSLLSFHNCELTTIYPISDSFL